MIGEEGGVALDPRQLPRSKRLSEGDQVAGRRTGSEDTGDLPKPRGDSEPIRHPGPEVRPGQRDQFKQPAWDKEVEEPEVTVYKPLALATPRRRYLKAVLEAWMKSQQPMTRVITLKQTRPVNPGDLFGTHLTFWLLACPACGMVGELDHQVALLQDAITISPSIECPVCGWHDVVQGWALRRG